MSERLRGALEMVGAMAIAGTIGWIVVASNRSVVELVFWRCLFGAAVLWLACAALGLFRKRLPASVIALAALGGLALVANWLLLFAAFTRASIAVATVVYSTQPFILFALGVMWFGEHASWGKAAWLGLAFAGVAMIVGAEPSVDYLSGGYVSGVAMAFGAALCYALAAAAAKGLSGTPPLLITLIQVCVGALVLAPFADLAHPPQAGRDWLALAVLGVIYTGLLFSLQNAAIQRLPTHVVGSLYYVYPLVAIVVDVLAFGQRLDLFQIIGAGGVLLAAAGMNLGWWAPNANPR